MSENFEARYNALSQLSDLMDDAVLMIDLRLDDNPSPENRRLLWEERDRLVREKAVVESKISALLDAPVIDPPNPQQVSAMAALTAEVERALHAAQAASAALALSGRVFEIARTVSAEPIAV